MLRAWGRASFVLMIAHVAALFWLFFVLFCLARYEADNPDADCSAVVVPGRYVMENVLMQPAGWTWGDWPGCFDCFGLLLNSAVWGVAGGLLVAAGASACRWVAGRAADTEP